MVVWYHHFRKPPCIYKYVYIKINTSWHHSEVTTIFCTKPDALGPGWARAPMQNLVVKCNSYIPYHSLALSMAMSHVSLNSEQGEADVLWFEIWLAYTVSCFQLFAHIRNCKCQRNIMNIWIIFPPKKVPGAQSDDFRLAGCDHPWNVSTSRVLVPLPENIH